ncbi:LuxR family transcriptional regulator [Microbacterium sp. SORGH_AS_0888]|uniref:helix-turn-helix transcriptional regulator n=1 Tax=Microbacterium sp. SORGH_AS_0888 TaxID=3041791 RepID=UPI002785C584|nr:LuxR family transcriptional regulator [Microbacterium sp. SORGH_AS_0888]MDQ1130498.1 DNA-binding CsgD family transcriptional regulator [Microbacterium sp. SORGH_AS_0888]
MLAQPEPAEPHRSPPTDEDRDQVYRLTDAAYSEVGAQPASAAAIRAVSAVIAEIAPASSDDPDTEPAADEEPGDHVLRALTRMATARQRGDFPRAVELTKGLRAIRPTLAPPSIAGAVAEQCALTYLLTGDSITALVELAASNALNAQVPQMRRRSLLLSSMVHSMRGNLREAGQRLHAAQLIGSVPSPPHTPSTGWESLAAGMLRIESGARGDGTRTAPLPEIEGIGELWPLAMLAHGRESLIAHSPLGVIESAEFALQCHTTHGPTALSAACWLLVYGHLGLGDIRRAEAAVAEYAQEGRTVSILARARLLLEQQRHEEARDLADSVLGRRAASVSVKGEALLLRIWADCLIDGRSDPLRRSVAVRLATHSGLLRPFAQVPRWLIDEIADAVEGEARTRFRAATEDLAVSASWLPGEELSPRERIVLRAIFEHESVADIASALYVSPSTVKSQLSSVYRKLGVHSRTAAIAAAVRAGLHRPLDG